jgi:hypothetical protein
MRGCAFVSHVGFGLHVVCWIVFVSSPFNLQAPESPEVTPRSCFEHFYIYSYGGLTSFLCPKLSCISAFLDEGL